MTILAYAVALLRHVENFTIVALAIKEIFAPGDAIAYLQRVATHIKFYILANLLDDADDLMAENPGTWIRPTPFMLPT